MDDESLRLSLGRLQRFLLRRVRHRGHGRNVRSEGTQVRGGNATTLHTSSTATLTTPTAAATADPNAHAAATAAAAAAVHPSVVRVLQ